MIDFAVNMGEKAKPPDGYQPRAAQGLKVSGTKSTPCLMQQVDDLPRAIKSPERVCPHKYLVAARSTQGAEAVGVTLDVHAIRAFDWLSQGSKPATGDGEAIYLTRQREASRPTWGPPLTATVLAYAAQLVTGHSSRQPPSGKQATYQEPWPIYG